MIDLMHYPQWVIWKLKDGRKPPYSPRDGGPADVNDPATWSTFEQADRARRKYGADGIGFVFTPDDPFTGVDIDDCLINRELTPLAARVVDRLCTYTEISPSMTGIKVFCRGNVPNCTVPGLEVYSRKRYFTVTCRRWPATPLELQDRQSELERLVEWMQRRRPAPPEPPRPTRRRPVGGNNQPYVTIALERELERLRCATANDRNNTLNRVAFSLGTLVGAGELDEGYVTSEIARIAADIGLERGETRLTIHSGLRAGKQRPRAIEAPRRPD